QYVWEGLESERVEIIPPCIDAFSPKNQPLDGRAVSGILEQASLVATAAHDPVYTRQDGETARVTSTARMREATPVPVGVPLVTQISRWDPLKDHRGVLTAFTTHVPRALGAHLVLAGPSPDGVDDDPEESAVYAELSEAWEALPRELRARVHLASLPMR